MIHHDLPAILLSYGVELQQSGQKYMAKCIAHSDRTPSMSVYINGTGKYTTHCFGCGFHEDAIGVVAHMEGITQSAAAEMLGDPFFDGKGKYAKIIAEAPRTMPQRVNVMPPPDAPVPKMDWLTDKDGNPFGEPQEVYIYRTPSGDPWMYEARYMVEKTNKDTGEIRLKKEPRCFSWGYRGSPERVKWECAFVIPPRPLYGLDMLETIKSPQVIVCEGPRKAFSAQTLIPSVPAVGASGGCEAWHRTDWSPIAGKMVLMWPDADKAGRDSFNALAQHLIGLGCEVSMINTTEMPDGWDAADAVADGWDKARTMGWARDNKTKVEKQDAPHPIPEAEEPEPPINHSRQFNGGELVWQQPQDVFAELIAPALNAGMIPECMVDWVFETSGITGTDSAILALSAVVCSAAVLHDGIKLQPEEHNPSWKESARLWGAIVGDSSIKKTPGINKAKAKLMEIQIHLSKDAEILMDEQKSVMMAYEMQKKEYIKKLSQKEIAETPQRPETPEIPRLVMQDVTVDKIRDLICYSSRGCFVDRDELSGWFGSMDAYKSGAGGSDRSAWLEFYNGGARYIDRVGAGSVFVPNWGGCLLGGIQPDAMRKISNNLPEDGLLQRFMVVCGRTGKEGNEKPYNKPINDRYNNMLQGLFELEPGQEPIKLTQEANSIRKEIVAKAYQLMGLKFISSGFCSHLGKWEGLSARLLLTFHAIECADKRQDPQASRVSESTARRVKAFMVDFLLPHSITFYMDVLNSNEIGKHTQGIANLILARGKLEIANRELTQGYIGWRHMTEYQQEQVINRLTDFGWIQAAPAIRVTGRKIPARFHINPDIFLMHEERCKIEIERRKIVADIIDSMRGK